MIEPIRPTEKEILDILATNYVADGYRFISEPPIELRPDFARSFRPDAIALKGDGGVLIEIKRSGRAADSRLADMARDIAEHHPSWSLNVVFADNFVRESGWMLNPERIATASSADLTRLEKQLHALAEGGHLNAALLLGWSVLEAATRRILPPDRNWTSRPLTAWQILEQLSTLGRIDPERFDRLKALLKKRNAVAHGELGLPVSAEEIAELIDLVHSLKLAPAQAA